MANFFDDVQTNPSQNFFDDDYVKPKQIEDRGFTGYLKDTGLDIAKGVVGLGESAVGLGNIVSFGYLGKGLEAIGYDPKQTQDFLSGIQSEQRHQAEQEVSKAEGFWDSAVALGANPSVLIGSIVQSLPGMVAAGGAGGMLAKKLGATAAAEAGSLGLTGETATKFIVDKVKDQTLKIAAAAAAGEGALTAGSIAEKGRQENRDWDEYVLPALAGGLGTTAIGIASFGIGSKLKIGDIETDIATRMAGAKGSAIGAQGILKRSLGEAAKEGALEEMPQSYQEQIFKNLATGRPTFEGASEAAAQGLLTGAGMGGAHAVISGKRTEEQTPELLQTPETLMLENKPDPFISFPDGSVGRQSDADEFISSLPEEKRIDARARLFGYAQEQQPEITDTDIINHIGQSQSIEESIVRAQEILDAPIPISIEEKNKQIDDAWSQFISTKREAEFKQAEQARRDQETIALQDELATQRVDQANALTKAQGFDTQEPNAMQLAMRAAQERRDQFLTPVSKRVTPHDIVGQAPILEQRDIPFSDEIVTEQPVELPVETIGINDGAIDATPIAYDVRGGNVIEPSTMPAETQQIPQQEPSTESVQRDDLRRVDARGLFRDSGSNLPIASESTDEKPTLESQITQVKSLLDAAGVTGRDRADAVKSIRNGELTVDDIAESYPAIAKEAAEISEGKKPEILPKESVEAIAPQTEMVEVERYTSPQLTDTGESISGNGMTESSAIKFAEELSANNTGINYSAVGRGDGKFDVIGESPIEISKQPDTISGSIKERIETPKAIQAVTIKEEPIQLGKELARYTSRQTTPDGKPKQGSGMTELNARQFSSELNRKNPELIHSPVERENGMYDVVGHKKDFKYSKSTIGFNGESDLDRKIFEAKQKYGRAPTAKNEGELIALEQKKRRLESSQKKIEVTEEDTYRDQHRAPNRDKGSSADDVTINGAYPDDFYSAKAIQYYGIGDGSDTDAIRKIQSIKGKKNASIKIYRAVPSDVKAEINDGDWVAISKKYAIDHGEGALNGDYVLVEKTVKAKDIFTNGDSIQEWGYSPEPPKFSKADQPDNAHTTESIRPELDKALKQYGKNFTQNLINTGKFKVISSDQARILLGVEPRAVAVFDPNSGVTSIIADRVGKDATEKELHGLMLHEVANHALGLGRSKVEFKKILSDLEMMNKTGNKVVKEAFNRARKAGTSQDQMAEEMLGYLLESNPELSIVKRAVAFLRQVIRSIGNKLPVVNRIEWFRSIDNMSVNDLTYAAQKALQRAPNQLAKQESVEGEFAFSKSKEAQTNTLSEIKEEIKSDGINISIYEKNNVITLSKIVVPYELRNKGIGTSAMQKLIDYADKNNKKIALTPTEDFGGNKNKLVAFYNRFGFIENKGSNKDFEISESMVRIPEQKEVSFSKEQNIGDKALAEIAKIGEAFKFKKSDKMTLEGIFDDVDSEIDVRKLTNIPGETRYELTLPDGTTARVMVRPFNKYGSSLYGYDFDADHNMSDQVTEKPGKDPEEAYGKDDVWIDVSLLNEGGGYGAKIYHAVANYAYNTGKVFIGDPAGVTHAAMLRRPEQMLSSALKFGTTEHLAPHPKQIKGNPKNGISPLDWVYGDDIGNIKKLVDANLQNIENAGGIGGIEYDKESGEFVGADGNRLTKEDLRGLAEVGLAGKAKAGGSTFARYAFLSSVVQSLPAEQTGRQPVEFMAELSRQLRDHVSALDKSTERTKDIFYSKSSIGNLTKDQERVIGEVFGKEKTLKEKAQEFAKDWKKSTVQGIFDQFSPVKELSNKAYMLLRLTKGASSALEHIMLYGKVFVDKDGAYASAYKKSEGMQGFAKVLSDLGGEHDLFFKWVSGLRAEKLKEIGLENLMSHDQIKVLKTLNQGKMQDGRSREAVYLKAFQQLNDFNDSVLKIAVESGLLDEQTRAMYKDTPYIPFYRLQEDGVAGFGVKAGVVNQTAWKKLKGGTSKLNDDMLANVLQNWSHLITASAKNRAAKATLDAAVDAGIAEEVPTGTPGKGFVHYKENGKEKTFLVSDDHVMAAIGALDYAGLGVWSKPFSAMKNALTIGVTINPTFKIRNLIRDSIQSLAVADVSYNVADNLKTGWIATQADSETRAQMLASGGMIRFGSMLDGSDSRGARRAIEKNLPKDQVLDNDNKVKALWNSSILPAFEAYQEFGDRGEQVNRAALYERLTAPISEGGKGMSHMEASFWARDMMDFSSAGKWEAVRVLTQIVPFMNARLQGLYKLGKASQEGETWKVGNVEFSKRMGYVIGAVALASIALMAAYKDDDDWRKRDDSDRQNYWWFKIGDKAFRIPKPFEIGAIGTIAEMGVEYFASDDMNGNRFMSNLGGIVGHQLSMNPIPQLMKPLLDVYANTDSFTKRPIESLAMQRLQAKDRYDNKTSEMARFLGGLGLPDPIMLMMGHYNELSPVKIDALTRGYFSWLGTMATTALDYGIRPMMDRGERPSMKIDDVFFVGNFVKDVPSASSRYVSLMYEQATAIEQAYNSYRAALKSGDIEKAKEILEEDRDLIAKYPKVEMVKRYESQINAQIKSINSSKLISASEKRKQIDILREKQDKIARFIN